MPITIKKLSRWEFITWASGGVGVGLVAASGGKVVLKSPQGTEVDFYYGGIGAGLGAGFKLPKLGRVTIPKLKGTATVGPTPFPSTGSVAITTDFEGDELTESNIRGLCCFAEAGGGLIGGGSGTAMLLNLDPKRLPLLISPVFAQYFFDSADAVLLMAGLNVGLQAGGGIAGLIGYLH
jgi:hypothetical protein